VGSDQGKPTNVYDLRIYLPPNEIYLIPDDDAPYQYSNATFNLPLDTTHGPYPLIIFIHGTAGWKGQSQHQTEHWASRGFVVISANYPGIFLYDMLMESELHPVPKSNQSGDTRNLLTAIQAMKNPDFQFLNGHIDFTRVSIIGHSAGANALDQMGDIAQVLIPMAGSVSVHGSGPLLKNVLVLDAQNDSITGGDVPTERVYNGSPSPKRMSTMKLSGHLFCTDICWVSEDEGGIVGLAQKYGIWQAFLPLFEELGTDGCPFTNPEFLEPQEGWTFTNYLTAAVLAETQMCDTTMAQKIDDWVKSWEYIDLYSESL